MRKPLIPLLLAILFGCTTKTAVKEVTQYTIEQFMNNQRMFGGSFSHDEKKILITNDESGVFNLYSISIEDGYRTQLTYSDTNSLFGTTYFPNDDRILFRSDNNGDEVYHIFLREPDGTVKNLTPYEGARSLFYGWMYDEQSFIYGSNRRDKRFMDVYEVSLDDFSEKMIYKNEDGLEFDGISRDKKYAVLIQSITTDNNEMYLLNLETKEVKHITEHEGNATYSSMDFGHDSKSLYYLTNEGSEYMYLRKYDIENDSHETVLEKDWDISYSYLSREGTYRITGINADAETVIEIMNTKTNEEVNFPSDIQGDITNVNISKSEKLMNFWVGSSKSPSDLYVYSFEDNSAKLLASTLNPELNKDDLVEGEVVRYPSFDDLEIPAILYKPQQASEVNKVPALVWVHGGPGGQSRLSYFPLIQYLVNHGYAILAVNNRGSSGYGKTFYAMDNQNHGEADLQDCVEGKNYLASLDFIDGEKIGIIGGSYGGFMVMAALTRQPEEFDVGVNLFGVTNWLRTLKSIPPWWESFREALYAEMGNPETDSVRLYSISPLFHADKITKPFMVLQGAQDPRVLQVESDEIVEAARENGVYVEYVLFDDEGHGFVKKENQIDGYGKVLTFLDEYLKKEGTEETEATE